MNLYKKIKSLFVKDKYDTSGIVDYLKDGDNNLFKGGDSPTREQMIKMLDNLGKHKTPLQEFIDISKSLRLRDLNEVPPELKSKYLSNFFRKDFQVNEIGDWQVVGRQRNGLVTFRHKVSFKVIEIHDYDLN